MSRAAPQGEVTAEFQRIGRRRQALLWQPPASLVDRVHAFRGGLLAGWLTQLPQLVAAAVDRWSLRLGTPFAYPSLSFVAPATRGDGTAVVLKIGPLLDELACEIAALQAFAGRGAVQLLDADADRGVLLLERLEPGTAAIDLADDDQAISAAITVMRELRHATPADHPFPTVAAQFAGLAKLRPLFAGTTGPLPARLVEQAEGLAADLWASMAAPVVLHGDLQHFNLLRAQRQPWLAIDPKGVWGEPAYEVGAFLRNELRSAPDAGRRLRRRVDRFAAELDLDRERVRGWGLANAVLSAWWSIEDHLTAADCGDALRCADLLDQMAR